jgi:hypothetical protein
MILPAEANPATLSVLTTATPPACSISSTTSRAGSCERADYLAARRVAHLGVGHHQRALVRALVHHPGHARLAHQGAFHRQRLHDAEPLLAVHDAAARDAGGGVRVPRAGIAEDDGHGGQRLQTLLVDEAELVGVAGVGAEPHPERVQDGVAPGEAPLDLGDLPVDQLVVVDRHATGSSARAEQRKPLMRQRLPRLVDPIQRAPEPHGLARRHGNAGHVLMRPHGLGGSGALDDETVAEAAPLRSVAERASGASRSPPGVHGRSFRKRFPSKAVRVHDALARTYLRRSVTQCAG